MGLFNRKKKDNPSKATDDLFKQFGVEDTPDVLPKNQTRKEQQRIAEESMMQEQLKERIIDKMNVLRKMMFNVDGFEEHLNDLEDHIQKMKQIPNGLNKETMHVIDKFIVKAIENGIDYCNRGSFVGMGACLDLLKDYMADRFSCPPYYLDQNFQKAKLQSDYFYVQIKTLEGQIITINERGAKLKLRGQDPKYKSQVSTIKQELQSLLKQRETLQKQIQMLDIKKQQANAIVENLKINAVVNNKQVDVNMDELIDEALDAKATNERQMSYDAKVLEKFNKSDVKLPESSLEINSDIFEENDSKQEDVSFDEFDF